MVDSWQGLGKWMIRGRLGTKVRIVTCWGLRLDGDLMRRHSRGFSGGKRNSMESLSSGEDSVLV